MSSASRLEFLSGRGHFLKGSSAALGLIKVRDSCEKLQNHGKCKDAAGTKSIPAAEALDLCSKILPQLKTEQAEATLWLQQMCGLPTSA